ncbi:MAG: 2-phosphosulfolactate phosphatase, partial [Rhodothermales bacterium]|nr:2-phosphosulfolactate phosphatase [Rhodothermales bacterium]
PPMNVEVYLTGTHVEDDDVRERTTIVIDVLRTSTTIASALANGARYVVPASDLDDAGTIASNLDPATYCLGGERSGVKIEGYRFGNSPLEYDRDSVGGKTLILTTTNGTPAIRRARHATHLIVGGFVNVSLVTRFVRQKELDVAIVCAGWRNRVSLEDTLCAGMILHDLWDGIEPPESTDTCHIAFTMYGHERHDIPSALRRSRHGKRLISMGLAADVDHCASVDSVSILPLYGDRRLVPYRFVADKAFA